MRIQIASTASLLALAAAGCAEPDRSQSYPETSYESDSTEAVGDASPPAEFAPATRDSSAAQGPGVAPTAAPGVAFNYSYTFRLPSERIAAMQEAHAAACEELGIARCRITGMRYRLIDETDIEAMLAFKLDPAIARGFGRDAGAMVAEAEGMLVNAEITGVDAGAAIADATREGGRIEADIAEIEARLAQPGVSPAERAQLDARLAQLRQSLRATEDRSAADAESLATTPMVFHYGSGDVLPGFDGRTPIRDALAEAGASMMGGVAFMIVLLGALLPFLVIGGIAWAIWRGVKRRRDRVDPAAETRPTIG